MCVCVDEETGELFEAAIDLIRSRHTQPKHRAKQDLSHSDTHTHTHTHTHMDNVPRFTAEG